eukprot:1819122-Amphidinium_carterae.1
MHRFRRPFYFISTLLDHLSPSWQGWETVDTVIAQKWKSCQAAPCCPKPECAMHSKGPKTAQM